MLCLRHAGALEWRRGPFLRVRACAGVAESLHTYVHNAGCHRPRSPRERVYLQRDSPSGSPCASRRGLLPAVSAIKKMITIKKMSRTVALEAYVLLHKYVHLKLIYKYINTHAHTRTHTHRYIYIYIYIHIYITRTFATRHTTGLSAQITPRPTFYSER